MGEGAPDYVHLRQILAEDALGNLVPVACDPSGRIILLPYGTQTVAQDDPLRTIQGADGLTLHTIAVDSEGRLVMLPYGWDGATYRPLKVDDEGRMIGVMKGQADVKWGLRGWWKFVASEGTTIKDYSGYNNNGSALSGVGAEAKYEDGVIGQAIELDGDNDYWVVTHDSSLDISSAISLEFWVYRKEKDAVQYLIITTNRMFLQWQANNTLRFRFTEDGVGWATSHITSETYEDINTWIHIVVTYNGVSVKIYVDGTEVYTNDSDSGKIIATPNAPVYFGIYDDHVGSPFSGLMDEVRIYARALSADEVAWRYANTNPLVGKPTRMIAVDSEGRMKVNVEGLPYKTRLVHREIDFNAGAGDYFLLSPAVPEGKMWIVTSALMTSHGVNCNELIIAITANGVYYTLEYDWNPGNLYVLHYKGQIIMGAGDKMSFWFNGAGAGATILYGINGYELDID